MEVEEEMEIHHPCKRSRMGNGSGGQQEVRAGEDCGGGGHRLRAWNDHASSRIIRVSRASGGKDRHSKVLTARGLRDRRVRLSVSTAIQFYDLQDRLGFDQPSKAVEWLINAASAEIDKLPALNCPFPELPKLLKAGEEKIIASAEAVPAPVPDLSYDQHRCSSTSDSSKGSVLSLSQSGMRFCQKIKRRYFEDVHATTSADHHHGVDSSLNSQSSFTELLTSGGCNGSITQENSSTDLQLVTADYFNQPSMLPQHAHKSYQVQELPKQIHFGSSPLFMVPSADHPEMQYISFMSDYLIPVAAVAPGGDYNVNFGLTGFNRGTLQSNSTPQLPNHHNMQRLLPIRGSNLPFSAAPVSTSNSSENQFPGGFGGCLQLYDGDLKGKGRN